FSNQSEPTVLWLGKPDPSPRASAFFASLRLSGFHFPCIVRFRSGVLPPSTQCFLDRQRRLLAGFRATVHEALEIVAAMFAGEKQIADAATFSIRDSRPLPRPVARVTCAGERMCRPIE